MKSPNSSIFAGTTFKALSQPRGKRASFTIESLASMFRKAPLCEAKNEQPLFSTATYEEDHRSSSRLITIGAIVGDHDQGTLDLDGAERRLRHYGLAAVLVTTFSQS